MQRLPTLRIDTHPKSTDHPMTHFLGGSPRASQTVQFTSWRNLLSCRKKQTASGLLGEDKVYFAREFLWSAAPADCFSMADTIAHIGPSQQTDPEVLDAPSSLPAVFDAYDLHIHSKSYWN